MKDFELELAKQEETLERTYPMILNFYYDYTNSHEYNNMDITLFTKSVERLHNQKMQEMIRNKQFHKLEDCFSEAEYFHEREGFIHGFLYASRLMHEINRN